MPRIISVCRSETLFFALAALAAPLATFGCAMEEPGSEVAPDESVLTNEQLEQVEQAYSSPAEGTHSNMVPAGYGCKWSDEFNGTNCNGNGCEIDKSVWWPQNLNVNNERQEYTNRECTTKPGNYNICVRPSLNGKTGVLELRARNDWPQGADLADNYGWNNNGCGKGTGCTGGRPYSSGRIMSKPYNGRGYSDTQGYLEIAHSLPTGGTGDWPSMFMLNDDIDEGPGGGPNRWPVAGELDVFEYTSINNHYAGNAHWDNGGHRSFDPGVVKMSRDSGSWHVVGVRWRGNEICWKVDGGGFQCRGDMNGQGEYSRKMHLLLNYAMGGAMGSTINRSDWSGARYLVDYVRWYKEGHSEVGFCGKSSTGTPTPPPSGGGGASSGSNLLSNSAFTTSLSGWNSGIVAPAAGVIKWDAYDGGIVKADLTAAGANIWDSKMYQVSPTLNAGTQYTMSARMRLATAGNETVYWVVQQDANAANKPFPAEGVTLTNSTYSTFTKTFTPSTTATYRIQLSLGAANAGIRIDDFKLCQGTSCI